MLSPAQRVRVPPAAAAARADPRPQRRRAGLQPAGLPPATSAATRTPTSTACSTGCRSWCRSTTPTARGCSHDIDDAPAPRAGDGAGGPDLGGVLPHQRAHAGAARRHRRHGRDPRLSVRRRLRPRDRLRRQGLQGRRHQGPAPTPTRSCSIPASGSASRASRRPTTCRCAARPAAKKVEVDVKGRVVREDPGGDIPSVPGAGAAADPRRRHPEPRAGGVRRRTAARR